MDDNHTAGSHGHDHADPEYNPAWTCVSAHTHDIHALDDIQAHFFGCLSFKDRVKALDLDGRDSIWPKIAELEDDKREDLRFQSSPESTSNRGTVTQQLLRRNVAKWLQQERKRIAVVRRTIKKDPEMGHLYKKLCHSRNAWRKSKAYQVGADIRVSRAGVKDLTVIPLGMGFEYERDEAERLDRLFAQKLDEILTGRLRPWADGEEAIAERSQEVYRVKRDIKAQLIALQPPGRAPPGVSPGIAVPDETLWSKDADVRGVFPHQFMALERLLCRDVGFKEINKAGTAGGTEENLEDRHIRYYHIPFTHMSVSISTASGGAPVLGQNTNEIQWAEDAIWTFFGGPPPEGKRRSIDCRKDRTSGYRQARAVLQRERWKGKCTAQPGLSVHSRHLRSVCQRFSTGRTGPRPEDENFPRAKALAAPDPFTDGPHDSMAVFVSYSPPIPYEINRSTPVPEPPTYQVRIPDAISALGERQGTRPPDRDCRGAREPAEEAPNG